MFKFASFVFLATLCGTCFSQQEFPLSELKFQGAFATHAGESRLYSLLGNGFIRTIRSDDEAAIVAQWRKQHPDAKAIPVSVIDANSKTPMVYVWAVDGDDNLNLRLVRQGIFPASVMLDAVHFDRLSKGTSQRTAIEAGYAYGQKLKASIHDEAAPPQRLISEARYKNFLKQLVSAETDAQAQKNGIWSDKFKGLRDQEDVLPLNALPPFILGY